MRVVIVEDQVLLREGLARLFVDGGHQVVATRGDAEGLLPLAAEVAPDLVVLDVRMPPTHTDEGIRAAAELKAAMPHLGVLVLSQHVETVHSVGLIEYPAFGYLLKDRVLEVGDFLATCERVAAGGSALDPKVVANLVGGRRRGSVDILSEREAEVLGLMAEGLTNTGIAQRLVISDRTVESHVRRLFAKLDIPESANEHRRVLAVLAHLRGTRSA
ncbi:response regulator transcription factor [Nostocoides sp. HKS02]|uniref:LuxR C-terminal-related transcriptional regulator n=1 Tax=Nostocoides sp. HKS02 TaxID=1813880 RepID=UPI0012B49354|nr:response regulator transcription factor [Tetrasphaera sp. HKS02]QGN58269.1 response regulator [Tetrasphaera sp. HKS02]